MEKEHTPQDAAYDYWDFVQFRILQFEDIPHFRDHFGFPALEARRTEFHDALCKALGLDKEVTRQVTDNLDRYDCFERFWEALKGLKNEHH